MFSVQIRTGRLLEMRLVSPMTAADVQNFLSQTTDLVRKFKNRLVGCTDLRNARILAPDVADKLTLMMRSDNPMIERNGIIVGEGAVFSMQIERMLREAGSPLRRSFREPTEVSLWLGEVLDVKEQSRLRAFMAEGVSAAGAR